MAMFPALFPILGAASRVLSRYATTLLLPFTMAVGAAGVFLEDRLLPYKEEDRADLRTREQRRAMVCVFPLVHTSFNASALISEPRRGISIIYCRGRGLLVPSGFSVWKPAPDVSYPTTCCILPQAEQ